MAADTEKPLSKRALDKRMDNNVDASDTRILLIEPTGPCTYTIKELS